MNIKLIIITGIIGISVLAVAGFFFLQSSPQTAGTQNQPPTTFPSSSSGSTVSASTSATVSGPATITVASPSGNTIVTNDFIHNGTTIPDSANKGRYLIAGSLGYCVSNQQGCQAGTSTDFNIFYDSTSGAFTIALLKEPLGQVRLEMEQSLMQTLGISQSDMCKLNYYVGTTSDINPQYDSKNLGFSFCPGATPLPQ